eukprot:m.43527 g.43527  ORF g.43527 m.43527 type:complete len:465 (-) comp6420_c0_seq1:24-1418(-)
MMSRTAASRLLQWPQPALRSIVASRTCSVLHHTTPQRARVWGQSCSMSMTAERTMSDRPVLQGLVFDMDDTLVTSSLDLPDMKRQLGLAPTDDILASIAAMSPSDATAARAIVHRLEKEGMHSMQLMPGAAQVGQWLARHGVPMAVVTRNTSETLAHFNRVLWTPLGLPPMAPALSRDDPFPPKPHPGALHHVAQQWGVSPSRGLVMVGDSLRNDIGSGKAAGFSTAWLDLGRHAKNSVCQDVASSHDELTDQGPAVGVDEDVNRAHPTVRVTHLMDLARALYSLFDIPGRLGTAVGPLPKYPAPQPDATHDACMAAATGDVPALETMSDPSLWHTPDTSGNTPIVWAADRGHVEVVRFLQAANADLNARGFLGATAVARASRNGHVHVLRVLGEAEGVNLDVPNDKMQSPLHIAAFHQQHAVVETLLELGASPLVLDRKGRTPAHDTTDEHIRSMLLSAAHRV